MLANGSIAVWCIPLDGAPGCQIELHFNYWKISDYASPLYKLLRRLVDFRHRRLGDFVEVGIMISNVKSIKKIHIYFPTEIKHESLFDCSQYFSVPEIAQGIFNDVLLISAPATGAPQCITLSKEASTIFCKVHKFGNNPGLIDKNQLSVNSESNGTIVTITEDAISKAHQCIISEERYYFRLRIYLDDRKNNPFINSIPQIDRFLLSGYNQVEYLDFRVNDTRTLPHSIEQKIRSEGRFGNGVDIKLIAFLTALPVHSGLTVSNTPTYKMRLLEREVWNKYVPSGIPKGSVVYHWKRTPEGGTKIFDFTSFVKLETRRSTLTTIITYILIAFIFGVAGNLVAACILSQTTSNSCRPNSEVTATNS